MIKKYINYKWYSVYAFDIETDASEYAKQTKKTRMWLGCFINDENKPTDENSYFYSMKDVLNHMLKLTEDGTNLLVYVHNLAFEWSFIQPYLIKNEFQFKLKIAKHDKHCYSIMCNSTVTSVWKAKIKGSFYAGEILFRDTAKIFCCKLATLAKEFNLQTQKGDIDYEKDRHLDSYVPTQEEKEYCFKDVRVIIDILLLFKDNDAFWQALSAASFAFKQLLFFGYGNKLKPNKNTYKYYRKDYPSNDDLLERRLFRGDKRCVDCNFMGEIEGGLTWVNPKYQFGKVKNLIHIDMHQAHPSSAYLNEYPYGRGLLLNKKDTEIFFKGIHLAEHLLPKFNKKCILIHAIITCDFVSIPIRIEDIPYTYTRFDEKEVCIWGEELKLMIQLYKGLKIKYIEGYLYRTKFLPFKDFYLNNFNNRLIAKKEGKKYLVALYKLYNNSTYGKFNEVGNYPIYIPCYDEKGYLTTKEITLGSDDPNIIKPEGYYTYLPVGTRIAMWTRIRLIETALKFGIDNIVYTDTDSLFILKNEHTLEVLKTINMKDELGGWGLEDDNKVEGLSGVFACAKRYKLFDKDNNIVAVKMAGITPNEKLNNNLQDANIFKDKIKMMNFVKCPVDFNDLAHSGGEVPIIAYKEINIKGENEFLYTKNKDLIFNE